MDSSSVTLLLLSLFMKYSSAITFFLIGIGSLFFITKIGSAQTLFPQIASQKIPSIDPDIAQAANKYTYSVDLCPPTNNPLIARCFGKVLMQDTFIPFTSTKPA